ncbi:hypothetical protein OAJ65_00630 [Flavobacteriales bacterium]|nr:hypothetical protein [Flavobacteriales bacterium]
MKKILYPLLAVSIICAACKKEEDEVIINGCMNAIATNYNPNAINDDGSCTYSIIGKWNVVTMIYDITEGFYTSGSYPNGSYTVTDVTSGVANYGLQNAKLTHEFSDNGFMTQIYNDDISNNQADTSGGPFVIIGDSIFLYGGQKGIISVTDNTLLMDLFHIDLSDNPNFQSFQFNHTSERIN